MASVTEAILTAESMRHAVIIIMAIRQGYGNIDNLSIDDLRKIWTEADEDDYRAATFHFSCLYSGYRLGLEHGRAGTSLDTPAIDTLLKAQADKDKGGSNETQKP